MVKSLFTFLLLFVLTLPVFALTTYVYDKYGKKIGYYVTNGNVTTYYNKYGSKVYEIKNGVKYDKYGKKQGGYSW